MAKQTLPTNFQDDILNSSMNGKRRYKETTNSDGSISLEDVSEYDQVGSNFGASQLNLMSDNINQSFDANKMLKTMEEVNAVTQEGYGVDALVVKQVNDSLTANDGQNFKFSYDADSGKYGYTVTDSEGADTFCPFSSGGVMKVIDKGISTQGYTIEPYTDTGYLSYCGYDESLGALRVQSTAGCTRQPEGRIKFNKGEYDVLVVNCTQSQWLRLSDSSGTTLARGTYWDLTNYEDELYIVQGSYGGTAALIYDAVLIKF